MPRSASKREGRSSVQLISSSAQDQEGEDHTPECLSQREWTKVFTQEDTEEAVGEIMDDLMTKVMEACHKVYIEDQLVDFSVSWAKSYIVGVLERQFICLDEAEELNEATSTEDVEPMPVTVDAWALGCVPVLKDTHNQQDPALHQETIIDSIPAKQNLKVIHQSDASLQVNILTKQGEKERSPEGSATDKHLHFQHQSYFSSTKKEKKTKHPIFFSPKKIPDKMLPPLRCSTEDTVRIENKNATGFASKLQSRLSQKNKKIIIIPKLPVSSLPQHCIVPQYEILDNCEAKTSEKIHGKLPRKTTKYNKQAVRMEAPVRLSNTAKREISKKKTEEDVRPNRNLLFPLIRKIGQDGMFPPL